MYTPSTFVDIFDISVLQECESGVSLDYLEKLHQEYVKFINEMKSDGSQVLTYDWSTFKDEAIVRKFFIVSEILF